MDSTLKLLYDYVQDLECLIKKADELAKKRVYKNALSKFHAIENLNYENLTIRENEQLISLSRILADYGFCQTLESLENACSLLLADYDRTKDAVDMTVERLRKIAPLLCINENEADNFWRTCEAGDPWTVFAEVLAKSDDKAAARRDSFLRRIAKLASLERLAKITSPNERDAIAFELSPSQLETNFIIDASISVEIMTCHTNKTDLC